MRARNATQILSEVGWQRIELAFLRSLVSSSTRFITTLTGQLLLSLPLPLWRTLMTSLMIPTLQWMDEIFNQIGSLKWICNFATDIHS